MSARLLPAGSAAVVASMVLLTVGASGAQQVPAVGQAAKVQGDVLVTSHGSMGPKRLGEGDRLFEGDHIETSEESRVHLLLEDGSLVQVGGSSAIDLEWVLYAPALDSRNVILSADGTVRFVVEALVPRSSFEVKTPSASTSVEGADWIVATGAKGTWVIALEGEVTVKSVRPDVLGTVLLAGSDLTLVPPGERPGEVRPLPGERREVLIGRTSIR